MAVKAETATKNSRVALSQHLSDNIQRLIRDLETILRTLTKIDAEISSKRLLKKVKAFVMSNPYAEAVKRCKDDLDWAITAFEVASRVADAVQQCELATKIHLDIHDRRLEALPRSKYASHSSDRADRPSTCFQGTRTAIIDMIFDWIYDTDPSADQIFFLNGIAGVGKTTIARTVAKKARGDGLLGGDYFFTRQGEVELRDSSKVFPTLAYQLAHFDSEFGRRIVEALEKNPDAPYESLKQQLDHLIIEPLSGVDRDPKRTVVIVFDAFDECEPRGAKDILHLLLAAIPSLPFFLKIFLTGRPEDHILSVLAKPTKRLATTALHDIEPLIVKGDIRLFLRAKLAELPGELRLDLPLDWAAEHEIELMIKKSDGLFIYAITVIRFLSDPIVADPRIQLDILMSVLQSNTPVPDATQPFCDLDALYMQLLRGALLSSNTPYVLKVLQATLGTIVILRDPLPQPALEELAGLRPRAATSALRLLQSVIVPGSPPDHCPRIYHPSFPDFIQDRGRCTDDRFRVNIPVHEARLALACLKLLNTGLQKGVISDAGGGGSNRDIEDLQRKVASAYTPPLKYACHHWASHLTSLKQTDAETTAALETFARRSLLLWLEAMSWFGELRSALKCLEISKAWTSTSTCSSDCQQLLNDGHRLVLAHFSAIADSAAYVTGSVIPFIPSGTKLAAAYSDYDDHSLKLIRGIDQIWSPCLMILDMGSDALSISFSPDSTRLACGTYQRIRTLDSSTGVTITDISTERQMNYPRSIAFISDGSEIVSGPSRAMESTCIWDATTGRHVSTHRDATITCVSPDGKHLAGYFTKGPRNQHIQVWAVGDDGSSDAEEESWEFEEEATPVEWDVRWDLRIYAIQFSSTSSQLAAASGPGEGAEAPMKEKCAVHIWDTNTGASILSLKGHSDAVICVAFSNDGHHLASGSRDTTIRIWDIDARTTTAVLEGHTDWVRSLQISSDGRFVVSGCGDGSVMLWNAAGGQAFAMFRGHTDRVNSVAFAPDGTRVASCSKDQTVRIWDASMSSNPGDNQPHSTTSDETLPGKPLSLSLLQSAPLMYGTPRGNIERSFIWVSPTRRTAFRSFRGE